MESFYLIAAALLHDIGKIIARDEKTKNEFRKDADIYYQTDEARYLHAKIGAWWLNKIWKGKQEFKKIIDIILFHHADYATYIKLADWLAAGERIISEKEITPSAEDRLINVFDMVFNSKISSETYYPLKSLSLEAIFPCEKAGGSYFDIIEELQRDIEQLTITNINTLWGNPFLEKLYYILFKYTWAIPAQTKRAGCLPDISLFSHLKATAAICAAIKEKNKEETEEIIEGIKRAKFEPDKMRGKLDEIPLATLLLGDLSGIQNFIFNIPSKGAAKSLKGRSIYLDLLMEVVASHILKEFNVPLTNIVYVGGGNFYLLLPPNMEEKIKEIRQKIEEAFYEAHKGSLFIAIVSLPLFAKDFFGSGIAEKMGERLHIEVDKEKRRKFHSIKELFKPSLLAEGDKAACDLCQDVGRKEIEIKEDEETGFTICNFCNSLKELTKQATKANYLFISDIKPSNNPIHSWALFFKRFGFSVEFREDIKIGGRSYLLNEVPKDFVNIHGFKFIPTAIPLEEGDIVPFEEIVKAGEGAQRLGILKLDVDNLGQMFAEGFGKDASISRLSFLSTMLSLFFGWYVCNLAKDEPYRKGLYLIFSGGDDTFAVGAWEKVLTFLEELRKSFEDFTKNPKIHFSSAFDMVDTNFPVIRFSENIEEILSDAKKVDDEKNKTCFLGVILPWGNRTDKEVTSGWALYNWMREIERSFKDREHLSSFVKRLAFVSGIFSNSIYEARMGKPATIKSIWRFAYGLREWFSKAESKELVKELVDLNKIVILNAFRKRDIEKCNPNFIFLLARLLELKERRY